MLGRAIPDAALEQLRTVGWNGLTMEGVTAGARTGKAAVYHRCWPSEEDPVADALRAGLSSFDAAPDEGSVRDDLPALCLRAPDAMFSRPGAALCSVIHECDSVQSERFHAVIFEGVVESPLATLR